MGHSSFFGKDNVGTRNELCDMRSKIDLRALLRGYALPCKYLELFRLFSIIISYLLRELAYLVVIDHSFPAYGGQLGFD